MRFSLPRRYSLSASSPSTRLTTKPVLINKSSLDQRPVRNIDKIVIKASQHHPAVNRDVIETFEQLRLRTDVVEALTSINITQPTVIQTLTIPKILGGKNVLCAAETGSGKTLAYLAPLISRLRDEEEHHGLLTRLRHPKALILLHSRELANQVLSVAKSLSHVARCKVVGLIGGPKKRFIKDYLMRPIDIAIATPTSFFNLKKEDQIQLSDVRHLVIDEADTLLDESFQEVVLDIVKSVKIRQSKPPPHTVLAQDAQLTIVGATFPNSVLNKINQIVPNIKKVTSKSLHQILPHVEQKFIKVSANEKGENLLKLLGDAPKKPTIVFCNSVPSCDWTTRFLESRGVSLIKLHAGCDLWARQFKMNKFIEGKANVLVTTDVTSRGIDIPNVTRVILFDWPHGLTDYLHRVGRTGRVGTKEKCVAISFMTRRRDVKMAWAIKDAAEQREALLNRKVVQRLQKKK